MKKGNQRPISVSASCFLPTALFSLPLTARLAEGAGFAGLEVVPFRGVVLGGIPRKLAVPITSAHCHFNPIPILQKAREFGKGAALTDLMLFPPNVWCERLLAKLNSQGASVNTYFIQDLMRGVYNSFQAYPDLGLGLEGIVNLVETTGFKITYDLRHMRRDRDQRQGGGFSPFPNWRASWEAFRTLVDNVHVQYLDLPELQAMLGGDEGVEIALMLRHIRRSGYEGLITLEVSPIDVARLIGPKTFLPQVQVCYLSQLRKFVEAQLT